jgi:hypothetical protein
MGDLKLYGTRDFDTTGYRPYRRLFQEFLEQNQWLD